MTNILKNIIREGVTFHIRYDKQYRYIVVEGECPARRLHHTHMIDDREIITALEPDTHILFPAMAKIAHSFTAEPTDDG